MMMASTFVLLNEATAVAAGAARNRSITNATTRQKPTDAKNTKRSAIGEPMVSSILEKREIVTRKKKMAKA